MKLISLLQIVLKVVGIIAFWEFIKAFTSLMVGLGLFSSQGNSSLHNSFTTLMISSTVLNSILIGTLAYLCLFKTNKLLSLLKINAGETIDVRADKKAVYHILILCAGVLIVINGLTNFLTFDYKTETKTELTSPHNNSAGTFENKEYLTQTESKTKHVNFFAFIEIIIGMIFLAKSDVITEWALAKFSEEEAP